MSIPALVLVSFLVPIAVIDLDRRRIPDALTLPAAVVGLLLIALLEPDALVTHVVAALGAGGLLLAAALARPGGMGMGDVKLAAVLGLYLGPPVAVALVVALGAGTVFGAFVVARKGLRAGRETTVAFGPFLAAGGLVASAMGDALLAAYAGAF